MIQVLFKRLNLCLFGCLMGSLCCLTTVASGSAAVRLECDFTNRESSNYIKEFVGTPLWFVEVDLKLGTFDHLNHSKRWDAYMATRPTWLDGKGQYEIVEITSSHLIAVKRQVNLESMVTLNLQTGHLHEDFAIKRSNYGNAMDWNHEFADADCTKTPWKPLNLEQ